MFNIDFKSIKKRNTPAFLLIVPGFIFILLYGTFFLKTIIQKNSMDSEVKANYIESVWRDDLHDDGDSGSYFTVYHYTVNGEHYTCESNISGHKTTDSTGTVYYKKDNPKECVTEYSTSNNWLTLCGVALGGIFFIVGIVIFIKNRKVIKKAKYLSTNGKLIKGIPYRLEDTGVSSEGEQIKRFVIDYTPPNNPTIHLTWDPTDDYKIADSHGLVDLLINPNDLNNYYIDFEITYSGNVQVENYNSQFKK